MSGKPPRSSMRTGLACLVAAALGMLTVATLAEASGSGQLKSTLSTHYLDATIPVGEVYQVESNCASTGQYAITGGFLLTGGNFMWVLGTGPTKNGRGWFVKGLVPNKIAAPGVLPAKVLVKAVCAEKGKAIVP